mmetsp:Transcript_37966/g.84570  ORF Transcript_37966/g.84570 Transcript_37966/m.84570 type:complete len:206 (-) Transcript_37966:338-955(-)
MGCTWTCTQQSTCTQVPATCTTPLVRHTTCTTQLRRPHSAPCHTRPPGLSHPGPAAGELHANQDLRPLSDKSYKYPSMPKLDGNTNEQLEANALLSQSVTKLLTVEVLQPAQVGCAKGIGLLHCLREANRLPGLSTHLGLLLLLLLAGCKHRGQHPPEFLQGCVGVNTTGIICSHAHIIVHNDVALGQLGHRVRQGSHGVGQGSV